MTLIISKFAGRELLFVFNVSKIKQMNSFHIKTLRSLSRMCGIARTKNDTTTNIIDRHKLI